MNTDGYPDLLYMVLMGIVVGEPVEVDGGELVLVTGGNRLGFPTEVLDLLEYEAKWVYIVARGPVANDLGKKALQKWLRRMNGAKGVKVDQLQKCRMKTTTQRKSFAMGRNR